MNKSAPTQVSESREQVVRLLHSALSKTEASPNAVLVMQNDTVRIVTGVTVVLQGEIPGKGLYRLSPVTAFGLSVLPREIFSLSLSVPKQWTSVNAEIASFRSGDLLYTRRSDDTIEKRFLEWELPDPKPRPMPLRDKTIDLTVRRRKCAVWSAVLGAVCLIGICCAAIFLI